jgi:nitroimidazol reductase NimA-like FMN-containing flavoprotein (pyridoxamine 5'-phosphate oxidase superfamily)
MSDNAELSKNVRKYLNKPRAEVRRKEDAVNDEAWLKALLTRGAFGTLGTSYMDQPFITPVLFVYIAEEHKLYIHGAQVGRMRANLEANPNVVFNVSEFGQILPAEKAVSFNVEYRSVTVFGTASVVPDPQKAEAVLQSIMDKYAPHLKPGQDYIPTQPEDLKRTAVFQVDIEEWSGKQQLKDDYLDAYDYPYPPLIQNND